MNWRSVKTYLMQNRTVGITGVLLTVLALYGTSDDLMLFADDYISWATVKSSLDQPWWHLVTVFYNPEFYRPLDLLLIRADMAQLGDDPFLYRWATIVGHMLTVLSVYWFVRRLRFDRAVALLAGAFFALSHANAMAALSNDAASQVYSTFCGMMALGFALRRYPERPLLSWEALISAAWLFVALMWKDAGISYVPALAVLLIWELSRAAKRERVARAVTLAAPYVVVLTVYFLMRWHSGAGGPEICGPGRYGLCPGLNVPKNIMLFLLAMVTPVGSSIIVLRLNSAPFMTAWVASMVAVLVLLGGGVAIRYRRRVSDRAPLIVLLVLLFVVMTPDVFLNQVSELYAYKPNAIFAAIMGAAIVAWIRYLASRNRRVWLAILVAFLLVLAWSHGQSIVHKTQRIRTGGVWCAKLMNEIRAQLPELPTQRIIVSNRDPGPAPFYSIYYMEGAYVLGGGKIFEYYYGDKIEEYRFAEWAELDRVLGDLPGKKVILLYERDHVRVAVTDGTRNPFSSGETELAP
ncbi:MAG: hypothetical protein P9L99_12475 [Candidatus Lernaella stagnicola]|nr:hypothetical protein [Candidatus Lernaella stagnicola]